MEPRMDRAGAAHPSKSPATLTAQRSKPRLGAKGSPDIVSSTPRGSGNRNRRPQSEAKMHAGLRAPLKTFRAARKRNSRRAPADLRQTGRTQIVLRPSLLCPPSESTAPNRALLPRAHTGWRFRIDLFLTPATMEPNGFFAAFLTRQDPDPLGRRLGRPRKRSRTRSGPAAASLDLPLQFPRSRDPWRRGLVFSRPARPTAMTNFYSPAEAKAAQRAGGSVDPISAAPGAQGPASNRPRRGLEAL